MRKLFTSKHSFLFSDKNFFDTFLKFFSLKTMAKLITGKKNMEFGEMIRHLMENMASYKNQYCEGIPKLRLIKLLLIELAELKKEDEQKIVNGELPPLRPGKISSESRRSGGNNVLQPAKDNNQNMMNRSMIGGNSIASMTNTGTTNRTSNRSFLHPPGGLDEIPEINDNTPKGSKVPALNIG